MPSKTATQTVHVTGDHGRPVPLRVSTHGAGPPMVFLHGLLAQNEHWLDAVRHLEHRFRCELVEIPILDLPDEDCSIGGATGLILRFLDSVIGGPSILVGNSFGGHIALRVAMARPDLVSALVLVGPSGLAGGMALNTPTTRPSRQRVREGLNELLYDPAFILESDIERIHEALGHRSRARAMVRLSRSVRADNLAGRLRRVAAPALLLWGRQDRITRPEVAHMFEAELPDTRTVWFDRCGHVPMIEHPQRFADEVLAFAGSVVGERA
jgi:pimeloyl-ACP methyl ester carboxylesterase